MILGVDPGYAKCGWAIVEPGTARVVALGLVTTQKRARLHVSADRASRVAEVCEQLRELAHRYGATTIAAEQALGFGAAAAVAANQLPWGAVIMLARMLGVELVEVAAKVWQRAVLGIEPIAKVKYEQVERALTRYVSRQLADVLEGLDRKDRRHPLDSTGVAMLAALRPELATRIIQRKES